MKAAEFGPRISHMQERKRTVQPPPDKLGRPGDWREQIKADLAAQLEAGATLYGIRSDGAPDRPSKGRPLERLASYIYVRIL